MSAYLIAYARTRTNYFSMETGADKPEQVETPKPNAVKRVTDALLYAGDFTPVIGRVKMGVEGVMGQTAGGFKLNDFERICYVSSVAFSSAGYYTWYLAAVGDFKMMAYTTALGTAGYWLTMVGGKARQTGEILSLPLLVNTLRSNVEGTVASVRSRITKVVGE